MSTLLWKAVFLGLFLSIFTYVKKRRLFGFAGAAPLPPGPPAHWLLGNQIPYGYVHRTFAKWTEEYGPVFRLHRGSTVWIIIGRQQAALDIMEKENASLVDRPRYISAGELASGDKRTLLVRHGKRFQKLRKALQSQLHLKVVETYEPIQTKAAKKLILDILSDPDQHQDHARSFAATLIMTMTYGKTTPSSYCDPEIHNVTKCMTRMGETLRPGAYLVDSYPILLYVPGYLNKLRRYHQEELALFRSQLDAVRTQMEANVAKPCFAKYLIEKQQEFQLSDDELSYLAGSMFGAGSHTTASAISVSMMAAAVFPEAQRKVQEQLDSLIGSDRLPSFVDIHELTEVSAFVTEAFRWRTVSVGGFPHRATKDIVYEGYVIPKGATVIANHWALSKDPIAFPDPECFNPSRWLTESGELNGNMKFFNFGFGRRVCPGQHVANRSLFITTALLLWAFNISEDQSQPIDTDAFADEANTYPLPFKLKFEPRIRDLRVKVEGSL